jgi:putative sigma-54 modulation protein
MQVTVKGKNTAVPEKLRARAERKLTKLQRFDDRILAMDVEFSEERNPRVADPHRVEVTLTTKSGLVRAHANATDPSAAVDQVVDRLERQVKKLKGRRVDRTQHADGVKAMPPAPPEGSGEPLGGAPVDRSEGSGEPHGGAPVDRSEGSGEPQGGAPVDREGSEERSEAPQEGAQADQEETDQAKVVYRRGDGGAVAEDPEP